jgi:LuxR family maltose regulon positive regulatory protein
LADACCGCWRRRRPNRAIAETLVLSLGTVKMHTRNIYGKLGVSNRTQAVTRARDMGLV